jgi:hypothetical protein
MERQRDFSNLSPAERLVKDGKYAMDLFKRSPAEYQAVRAQAVERGLIAPSRRQAYVDKYGPKKQHELTDYELKATTEFSKERCIELYRKDSANSKDNPATLKSTNPERYALLRTAGILHGVLAPEHETLPRMPAPVLNEVADQLLPSEVAPKLNLNPAGKVTATNRDKAIAFYADVIAREKVAEQLSRDAEQLAKVGLQRNAEGTFSRISAQSADGGTK